MTRQNLFSGVWDGDSDETGTEHRVFWRPEDARMGATLYRLAPGAQEDRIHMHFGAEEMFFVLEGQGEVRIGDTTHPIRQGDVVACPPGGPEVAHQIINTSNADLKYLAVSTKLTPEIVDYPDSKKFGILAEIGTGPDGKPQRFAFLGRPDGSLDYYDGE